MEKFEYRLVNMKEYYPPIAPNKMHNEGVAINKLNEMGNKGWELMFRKEDLYYLKRRVK